MKERAVQNILDNMRNTDDPVNGAVFEKTVSTSLEDFCVFMLFAYNHLTMEVQIDNGNTIYLFYNGDDITNHVGSYIPFRNSGCFGGIRTGSKNADSLGYSAVKNPFNPDKFNFDK